MLKCRYYSLCDYDHQCEGCLFNPEEDREVRAKAKNGSISDMRRYKREKMREYRARNLREEFPFLDWNLTDNVQNILERKEKGNG